MRNIGRLLLSALVFCALLSAPAFADTCAAGNLSGLIGTTCDIGSLQFTFSGLASNGSVWSANDFTLTPVNNGFTLGFDGGAQSITAPASGVAYDYADLSYTVTDLGGSITGENVSGGALSASGTWGSYSIAEYYGSTPDSNSSAYVEPFNYVGQNRGSTFSTGGPASYNYGSPFSTSGTADAYPCYLYAENGASAGWDGSPTTFTYTTDNPSPVPEPGSMLLLGTGLIGMAERLRHKLRG